MDRERKKKRRERVGRKEREKIEAGKSRED